MFSLHQIHFVILVTVSVYFGFVLGSFICQVAYRLPILIIKKNCGGIAPEWMTASERLVTGIDSPGCLCPNCGEPILKRDLIPVLSWLMLRGKSRCCKTKISPRYLITEFSSGVLCGITTYATGATWLSVLWCFFLLMMLCIALIDCHYYLIPTVLIVPLGGVGILAGSFNLLTTSLATNLFAGVVVYVSLRLLNLFMSKQSPALGDGDTNLFTVVAIWLGAHKVMIVLLFASLALLLFQACSSKFSSYKNSSLCMAYRESLPFGIFIFFGVLVSLLFGESIFNALLN